MPKITLQRAAEASNQRGKSHVISLTTYAFDLDTRRLTISDYDFVFIGNDNEAARFSFPLTISVKAFRASAENIDHGIYALPDQFDIAGALQGKRLENVFLSITDNGILKQLILDCQAGHGLTYNSRFCVYLNYEIRLPESSEPLLFAGAIQPSDYQAARVTLGIQAAEKALRVLVTSKQPFAGQLYDPAAMDYFPKRVTATRLANDLYQFEGRIEKSGGDWERATYFAVSAA